MKPSLQVRLSQHLALTPQLQQSIRLLQLSTLELHQEVEQMLASNPLLDTEEEFTVSAPELATNAPRADQTIQLLGGFDDDHARARKRQFRRGNPAFGWWIASGSCFQ